MSAEAEALRVQREAAELGRKFHPREVLAVRMQPNENGADTIRDSLTIVLMRIWIEARGRGWRQEIEEALVRAEMVPGEFESHGEEGDTEELLMEWDADLADRLVKGAIEALGRG